MEHIFIVSSHEEYPACAVDLALHLSRAYQKPICFLAYLDKKIKAAEEEIKQTQELWKEQLSQQETSNVFSFVLQTIDDFEPHVEASGASIVLFQLSENAGYNKVKPFLKISRELRIPYIFTKPYFSPVDLSKIFIPVIFLQEDREKAMLGSGLGRFCGSELLLMTAKDFGPKATQNTEAIIAVLEKFKLNYQTIDAKNDSFKVELEAVRRAEELGAGMVIISASREYGLDDIIFGPKELACINEATVPIALINPRDDLYVLCD